MNVIDFAPLVQIGLEIVAGLIVTIAVPTILGLIQKKLNITVSANAKATLQEALENAVAYGESKVQDLVAKNGVTVEVKNEALAHAANYVIANVPDAMKTLGVDPKNIPALLAARFHLNSDIGAPATITTTAS